eukprot:NODE_477_length_7951_cov_0.254075.p1 type:complete len:279 gc:universal NODE_477_length_7951_cov_0.254075:5955-6791(+)
MQHYYYDGSLTVNEYNQLVLGYKNSKNLKTNKNVLQVNPDYYTLWNDRREMIPTNFDFKEELEWLIEILKVQPKSYWAWNHRLWCLSKVNLALVWDKEMEIIQMYLKKDGRNFHVWDYRKRILTKRFGNIWSNAEVLEAELDFTFSKVEENFSNYSALHWRSKTLESLSLLNFDIIPTLLKDIELLTNCFYSDPYDQSAWFYYIWFVSFASKLDCETLNCAFLKQYKELQELLEMEPLCKWVYIGLIKLQNHLKINTKDLKSKFRTLDPLRKEVADYL